MQANRSIDFFDTQFQRQVAAREFALNPFEQLALPHLRGRVLDLGCGLGNLSIEAARRGAAVTAVDGSASAIERIRDAAASERLNVEAVLADIGQYAIRGSFDTVVAIGLLMFFPCERARALLGELQQAVAGGGIAVVNVLVEGTTFMGMFDGDHHCLFGRTELAERFAGWELLQQQHQDFDAPGNTRKAFATVIARRPHSPAARD